MLRETVFRDLLGCSSNNNNSRANVPPLLKYCFFGHRIWFEEAARFEMVVLNANANHSHVNQGTAITLTRGPLRRS